MWRCGALLLSIYLAAQSPSTTSVELRKAIRSPDLVRQYIENHFDDASEPATLLKALGVKLPSWDDVAPCSIEGCDVELISIQSPWEQAIVRIKHTWGEVTLLRFLRKGQGWRFAGHERLWSRGAAPRIMLTSLGGKPFLLIDHDVEAGTGVYGRSREGFDLTWDRFEPAFEYLSEASWFFNFDPAPREIRGVPQSFESGPKEVLRVAFSAEYFAGGYRKHQLSLGTTEDVAVYTRSAPGKFKFDASLSTAPQEQIEKVYGLRAEEGLIAKDFLVYNLVNLKRIASGADSPAKRWLRNYLRASAKTAERRELQGLLDSFGPVP